jgi:hypothetical protein
VYAHHAELLRLPHHLGRVTDVAGVANVAFGESDFDVAEALGRSAYLLQGWLGGGIRSWASRSDGFRRGGYAESDHSYGDDGFHGRIRLKGSARRGALCMVRGAPRRATAANMPSAARLRMGRMTQPKLPGVCRRARQPWFGCNVVGRKSSCSRASGCRAWTSPHFIAIAA